MEKTSVTNDINLRTKIKTAAYEWILTSTSHGLPSIFRVDKIYLKVFWFICFLTSTGVCSFLVAGYLKTYFQYKFVVSTKLYNQLPTDFPAISICNLNPYYKNRSISFINKVLQKRKVTVLLTLNTLSSNDTPNKLSNLALNIIKGEATVQLTAAERASLGFYLDNMLITCSFAGVNCDTTDFFFFQTFDYGNCYTFNSGKFANGSSAPIKSISNAGPSTGLQLELFSGDPDEELFIQRRGFYVVVHNQSVTPLMENEGIHVGSGMQTNIGISRKFYLKLPYPYSSCIEDATSSSSSDSELYKAILDGLKQKSYRQKFCYKLCYQKIIVETCYCYDPRYPNPWLTFNNTNITFCAEPGMRKCLETQKLAFQMEKISSNCALDCPPECVKLTYDTSVSTAVYPVDFYLKWLKLQTVLTSKISNKTALEDQIKKSITKISFFYNDINYIQFTESASLTWDTLLGNIGGQLGLFIGISILSVVEMFEILFEIIRTIIDHKKQRVVVLFD
jgi:hypothetical protein